MGKQSNKNSVDTFRSTHIAEPLICCAHQGRLENPPWGGLLKMLCVASGADAAMMLIRGPGELDGSALWHISPDSNIHPGIRAAHENWIGLFDFMTEIDIRKQIAVRSNTGQEDFDLRTLFMAPFGIGHILGAPLSCKGSSTHFLFLLRGEDQCEFSCFVHDLLNIVLPHIETSVNSHLSALRQTVEKVIYGDALSRLGLGMFILDTSGKVMECNQEAEWLLHRKKDIRITKGRLEISKFAHEKKLHDLIGKALEHRRKKMLSPFSESIRLTISDDCDIGIKVETASLSEWLQFGLPAVVVSVVDMSFSRSISEERIMKIFGVTRAEARLVAALASGLSLREAGDFLNLTEHSVRTYSKKIYSKVGVCSQAELMRTVGKTLDLVLDTPAGNGGDSPVHVLQ